MVPTAAAAAAAVVGGVWCGARLGQGGARRCRPVASAPHPRRQRPALLAQRRSEACQPQRADARRGARCGPLPRRRGGGRVVVIVVAAASARRRLLRRAGAAGEPRVCGPARGARGGRRPLPVPQRRLPPARHADRARAGAARDRGAHGGQRRAVRAVLQRRLVRGVLCAHGRLCGGAARVGRRPHAAGGCVDVQPVLPRRDVAGAAQQGAAQRLLHAGGGAGGAAGRLPGVLGGRGGHALQPGGGGGRRRRGGGEGERRGGRWLCGGVGQEGKRRRVEESRPASLVSLFFLLALGLFFFPHLLPAIACTALFPSSSSSSSSSSSASFFCTFFFFLATLRISPLTSSCPPVLSHSSDKRGWEAYFFLFLRP
eukprot:Rhum_TRINITY_DN14233_c11_g2::Rhum_TRINITY_DN14233_c11_g2_i1::g.76237::m.76237